MDAPVHGNFRRYYGMRSARAAARAHTIGHDAVPPPRADGVDERVAALVAWLALHEHRVDRVLDIGCNAAKPLLELCAMLEHMPQRVVGVDIDGALIGQARTALRAAWSQRAALPRVLCFCVRAAAPATTSCLSNKRELHQRRLGLGSRNRTGRSHWLRPHTLVRSLGH